MILLQVQLMKKYSYITPIGKIWIAEKENKICALTLSEIEYGNTCETPLIKKTNTQLQEYFNKKRTNFDIPLLTNGTEFQEKIWKTLINIPYGKTISYKELATQAGYPNAYRAVGNANNKNKILIIIPCHRVISSNGKISGYAGGEKVKQFLLDLESN